MLSERGGANHVEKQDADLPERLRRRGLRRVRLKQASQFGPRGSEQGLDDRISQR